jgi:hypothetical protein
MRENIKIDLTESLNTWQINLSLMTDRDYNVTDILNQIRSLPKVMTLNNITPEDLPQKESVEQHILSMKFISRKDPKEDLEMLKDAMLKSELETNDIRIRGIKAIYFKEKTLKKIRNISEI